MTTDLAALVQAQLRRSATCINCPPPPRPPTPNMRLRRIQTDGICDNGFCFEGNEFQFKTSWPNGSSATLTIEGVPSTGDLALNALMIWTTPATLRTLRVAVKETDGSSPDDIWAYVTYDPPPYVGDIPVTVSDNGAFWEMKQRPRVGVFDPHQLAVQFAW